MITNLQGATFGVQNEYWPNPWRVFARFAIFIHFSSLQGMPLLISFKFSSALWRIFARFAIACISGHKWRTLKGRQGERDLPRVGGWGEEIRRDGRSCFRVRRKRLSCIKELRYSSPSLSSASVFPRSLFRFRFCSQFSGGLKIKRKSFTT